jgi:hypothetical protein
MLLATDFAFSLITTNSALFLAVFLQNRFLRLGNGWVIAWRRSKHRKCTKPLSRGAEIIFMEERQQSDGAFI